VKNGTKPGGGLKIDTDVNQDPDELAPDSMSSRIVDSAVAVGLDAMLATGDGDLTPDNMSSRIGN
jgi:glucosamine-6-phosphate deaminase